MSSSTMVTRPITWLHLSDFHFASRQGWDCRQTLKALLRYLSKRAEKGWSPDFIFATGDIAWSGAKEEFEQAQAFFRDLAKSLLLSEDEFRTRLFVIPGNHDVDRTAMGPLDEGMLSLLLGMEGTARQDLLAETFKNALTMKLLGQRLAKYYQFTEHQLGAARRVPQERPWRVDFREVAGVTIAILQLNTACFSGPKDALGKLLLGLSQVDDALAEASTAWLRFVLQHHPFEFLADGREVKDRLRQCDGGHILLRGHLHDTEVEQTLTPDGSLIELAAGTVYSGTTWPKRFLIGEADLEACRTTVEFLTYSPKGAGFWAPDTLAYAGASKGTAVFDLPAALRIVRPAAAVERSVPTGTDAQSARARTLRARYRWAVAAVYGEMRFIGLPAGGARPGMVVQELFVPLRLRRAGQKSLATVELLMWLEPGKKSKRGDRSHRFVVLGEPGSGKTTLCRFVAVHFAASENTSGPLPLLLSFREYVRTCRESGDCSVVTFLAGEAKNYLQVGGIDEAWLEQALQEGNVLLILDGLDEVGSAMERGRMTDRVVAFCGQYPSLPMLLTSRFVGYDEATLPAAEFERLELLPFEDEDLRVFAHTWYSAQEPNNPLAHQQSADLLAALDAEPRVKALAGNPLLATLIALVHRFEAKLLGERAKLYEKVVQLLLETWPGQARRSFREVDEGLQRNYLESFALERQKKRDKPEAEVSFRRAELVEKLADLHCWRAGVAAAMARRQVEHWVDYLAAGTGILVEQQPGVFAFLHLSLLEYLAACALDQEKEPLEGAVVRLQGVPVWRETLLLAVGRHATDLPFLERLFDGLKAKEAWFFLVSCLREEAAFDAGKRAAILAIFGRKLLTVSMNEWHSVTEVVRTIERFSQRHREGSIAWRENQLSTAVGENLRGVVALSAGLDLDGALRLLGDRRDRAVAAADLLEFWPGSPIGQWAVERVDAERAIAFFESAPADVGTLRALAAFEPEVPPFLASALSDLRLRTTRQFMLLAVEAATGLEGVEREGGMGLPPVVQVVAGPDSQVLEVLPTWPKKLSQYKASSIFWTSRYFSREFAFDSVPDFARSFSRDFARGFAWGFARDFALDFALEFAHDFARESAVDFAHNSAVDFTLGLFRYLSRYFAFGFDSAAQLVKLAPVQFTQSADRKAWSDFVSSLSHKSREMAAVGLTVRRVGEAWIALETTAQRSQQEAESYFSYRLQNLAILYSWPAIDKKLPAAPSPEKLALYLELGWTQSTTTHDWPGTPRWIALLEGEPPAHWFPRAHWHLCWLLYQPDATNHQEGFNAALREGLAETDVSLRAAAETLEREMGFFG